ncbi:MAG: hypothetical protein LBN30_05755 [Oscillospiraceae bacterium]|nr:hypothetical protein [Oscillospiraceae bacterium]
MLFRDAWTLGGRSYWWEKCVDGKFQYAEFSQYDTDHDDEYDFFIFGDVSDMRRDWFDYGGADISKEEWNELTAPYFAVGEPVIEWVKWEDFDAWYARQGL